MQYDELLSKLKDKEITNKILNNLDQESIDVYKFIQKEFNKGDILKNHLFQFIFRSFYRLDNAGLTKEFKKRYFELLDSKETNIEKILKELYEIKTIRDKKSLQLSFITKLIHTINVNEPIFDSNIASLINLRINDKGNLDNRVKSRIEAYNKIKDFIRNLLKEDLEIFNQLRNKFNVNSKEVSDTKVIDFILWSYGNLGKDKKR